MREITSTLLLHIVKAYRKFSRFPRQKERFCDPVSQSAIRATQKPIRVLEYRRISTGKHSGVRLEKIYGLTHSSYFSYFTTCNGA